MEQVKARRTLGHMYTVDNIHVLPVLSHGTEWSCCALTRHGCGVHEPKGLPARLGRLPAVRQLPFLHHPLSDPMTLRRLLSSSECQFPYL